MGVTRFTRYEYHFVWVTKYRYPVLTGDVSERVRDRVRQICATLEIWMIKKVVSKDYVHILVSAPPVVATLPTLNISFHTVS